MLRCDPCVAGLGFPIPLRCVLTWHLRLSYVADLNVFIGNNYSIVNLSGTKNARIFFAQGCEVEPELSSQEA